MNVDTFTILVMVFSLIVGAGGGIAFFKYYTKKQNKMLLKNAQEVLAGTRKNVIKIDGQEYKADKFRVRDKDDKEIIINLKGGGIVEDGKQDGPGTRAKEVQEQEVETPKEAGSSTGSSKRDSGGKKQHPKVRSIIRPILSRIRRFG